MLQILFVAGVAMTIGTQATIRFFLRRKNVKVGPPSAPVHILAAGARALGCSLWQAVPNESGPRPYQTIDGCRAYIAGHVFVLWMRPDATMSIRIFKVLRAKTCAGNEGC